MITGGFEYEQMQPMARRTHEDLVKRVNQKPRTRTVQPSWLVRKEDEGHVTTITPTILDGLETWRRDGL